MTNSDLESTLKAFEMSRKLWSKVNGLVAKEMDGWGNTKEAIVAHIAFLGMVEAQTVDSLETCPLPEEMRTLLRVAAAQDYQAMKADAQKARGL